MVRTNPPRYRKDSTLPRITHATVTGNVTLTQSTHLHVQVEQLPLDLTLEVVDGRGQRARLPLSHFALLQPPLPARLGKADFMRFLPAAEIVFQTFEFPLAAFVAVNPAFDPQTVSQVQFVFDHTAAGVVVLDEVGWRLPSR